MNKKSKINEKSLRLTEAMNIYNKQFEYGVLNLLNAPPCCGKTTFIMNEFLNNTTRYIKGVLNSKTYNYCNRLSKILYVCDTAMLKDSVLAENDGITEKFGKGSIIDAKDFNYLSKSLSDDNGTIKVMTYSTLGWYMKNCKQAILSNFNIIIADELQNLFKYCMKYNVEIDRDGDKAFNGGEYVSLIDNLKELTEKILFIGMSGTENYIYIFKDKFKEELQFKIKNVFTDIERKTLFTHNFSQMHTNCIFNQIKLLNYNVVKEHGYKIFIYTRTISQSKKYKEWFEMNGIKSEWLCSINNKTRLVTKDEEGNEIIEEIPTMNDYQMSIRNRLAKGTDENDYKDKGTVPDDLDVLIVNGGYETGWNLIDDRFQIAFIDTTDLEEQKQARHRLRHDIVLLWCLCRLYNEDGYVLEYGQYGELVEAEEFVAPNRYRLFSVYEGSMKDISDKYIGIKLDKKLQDEIKFLYGIKGLKDKKVTWATVKRDLLKNNYIVDVTKNGTYIYKTKEGKIKKDSKKVVKKMNNLEVVKKWLIDEWDRARIPINEVRDNLDFGRKTWDKIISSDEFVKFIKDNKIKIKTIPKMGRTLYFTTY